MRSLSSKFLIPTLALIVVCLGIMAGTTYNKSVQSSVRSAELLNDAKLANIISLVEVWTTDLERDLTLVAQFQEIREAAVKASSDKFVEQTASRMLEKYVRDFPLVPRLHVIDPTGTVVASSNPSSIGKSYADREYFKVGITGRPYMSKPLISRTNGLPVVVVVSPIEVNGKVIGIVSSNIDVSAFAEKFINHVTVGKTGYIYVIDKNGLIITHRNQDLVAKLNIAKKYDWGKKMISNDSGSISYDFEGKPKLAYYMSSEKTGWIVCSSAPESDFFSESSAIGMFIMISALVMIVIIGTGIFIILRKNVISPVKNIVIAASAISEGNLETKVEVNRNDEIGTLQESLVRMVERLREMIKEADQKTLQAEEESQKAQIATQEAEEAKAQAERAKREGMQQAARELEEIVRQVVNTSNDLGEKIRMSQEGADSQRERTTESATAMEEMNATVMEVASNAGETASMAEEAKNEGTNGGKIITKVVTTIQELNKETDLLQGDLSQLETQAEDSQ